MNPTTLSRSMLESKNKDELQTIAAAMGGKPGSSAKKAEIVDLILGLAGVDGESASQNGSGATALAPATDHSGDDAPPAPDDAPAAGSTSVSARAGAEDGTEPPAEEKPAPAADTKDDSGDKTRGDQDGGDQETSGGQNRDDQETSGGQNRDDKKSGGDKSRGDQKTRGDQKSGGEQNRGDQKGSAQKSGEEVEAGNRRRRRRGRNRDRDRDRDRDREETWSGEPVPVAGYLDLRDEGYGFLRVKGYMPSKDDVYIPVKVVRQHGLRKGDHLAGTSRPAGRSEKNPALIKLEQINGMPAGDSPIQRPRFEDLTPLFPDEKLHLEREDDPTNMTCRIVDLISPIGKGQRGLIVSPPKAGKTTIMKEIARSIELNAPDVKVIVLLVDERPEEVTDMRRWLVRGEVVASTFDRPSDEHTLVAEMTIERAKRMVESGEDVVIILDGITRLSRAYNLAAPATGRIMSGGVDSGALYPPKRFFGAARNVEEGGSLTILATALVETGSKMDEVIFEEFKGTGNMELRLDRKTAERRIYPAIDVDASSTRHEELLFERKQLQQVWKLRRVLNGLASDGDGGGAAGLELLIDRLKTFPNNEAFLTEVAKGPAGV